MFFPNALSLTRIPLGIAIAIEGSLEHWKAAAALLVAALASDYLDGLVATKLDAKSDLGRDVLEPVCDLVLTVGCLVGLVLSHHLAWLSIVVLGVVAGAAQVLLATAATGSRRERVLWAFMPLQYVAVILLLAADYICRALSIDLAVSVPLAAVVALIAMMVKADRLAEWLAGPPKTA